MENTANAAALTEIVEGCLLAVEEEIDAVRRELSRRGLDGPQPAARGHLVDPAGGAAHYEWTLRSGAVRIRPDDAVRVRCRAGETLGFVTGWNPGRAAVRVATTEWLGRHPGAAELEFDPTWLLEALARRLSEIGRDPAACELETGLRLLGRAFPETGRRVPEAAEVEGLNPGQAEALARILGSRTQFVWGPPGTGKTRLLGRAVARLASEGTVLCVTSTNAALDEAAGRVVDELGPDAVAAGRIIRFGAEHSPSGDARLSLPAVVERRQAGDPGRLARRLAELEGELFPGRPRADAPLATRVSRVLAEAAGRDDPAVSARAGGLAGEMARAAAAALREARVVLTTAARLAVRDELAELRFDALVIDEASTLPLPHAFLAGTRARGRAVAFGDFQQLPAVVLSRDPAAVRWLRRDVFREAGVVRDGPEGRFELPSPRDALCAMLREQYRMRPAIRALVSDLFYDGRLADAAPVLEREAGGPALVLLDTTPLNPGVERAGGSRANPRHVEAVLPLLEALARAGVADVGVVAPYRLQARRLRDLARDRLGGTAPRGLEVSTIHRFQGREKRVLVFDTVDAPPGRSWFLDERRNSDFPRLLNVALSRSRDLLVLVGSPDGLRRTLPPQALLLRVMERIAREGRVVPADGPAAALGIALGSRGFGPG